MKKNLLAVLPILLALAAGCEPARTAAPPAGQPSPTASRSATPTKSPSPTRTITPTKSPTATKTPGPALPSFSGSGILIPDAAIGPDNAKQIVELARWGVGYAYDAAFSPDGSLLAAASSIGLRLYDADTLEPGRLMEQEGIVTHITFAPDGKTLAAADSEGVIRLWDKASGSPVRVLPYEPEGPIRVVESLAWSPDGKIIAAGSYGKIVLWDSAAGSVQRTFDGIRGADDLAFSPDGSVIASVAADETVELRDAATGKLLRSFGHEPAEDWELFEVRSPAFSPDGSLLAAGFTDGTIKIWRTGDGREAFTLAGHSDLVASLAFSADGKKLVSGSWDGGVFLWNAAAGTLLRNLGAHDDDVIRVAFSPDGKSAYSVSTDLAIVRWDMSTGQRIAMSRVQTGSGIGQVAFFPDSATLASGSKGKIQLWSLSEGIIRDEFARYSSYLGGFALSPDGRLLVTAAEKGGLALWNAKTGIRVKTFGLEVGYVDGISFSRNGKRLAVVAQYSGIALWDTADWRMLASFGKSGWAEGDEPAVRMAVLSPDGDFLAVGRYDGSIIVLFTPNGEVLWKGHLYDEYELQSIAYSPDGGLIATGGYDGRLILWDAAAGINPHTLNSGDDGFVENVVFSPDGKILAAAYNFLSTYKTVLWDSATRKKLVTLYGHTEDIISVAFSPDGKLLATGSDDGTICIWGVPPLIP
jgi:WD40 repeat protein